MTIGQCICSFRGSALHIFIDKIKELYIWPKIHLNLKEQENMDKERTNSWVLKLDYALD